MRFLTWEVLSPAPLVPHCMTAACRLVLDVSLDVPCFGSALSAAAELIPQLAACKRASALAIVFSTCHYSIYTVTHMHWQRSAPPGLIPQLVECQRHCHQANEQRHLPEPAYAISAAARSSGMRRLVGTEGNLVLVLSKEVLHLVRSCMSVALSVGKVCSH